MAYTVPMEVRASQQYDYNLGIKMVRGAYMNEERQIAQEQDKESPVWDEIEGTHTCYNNNLEHIISSMDEHDRLFVASHNAKTVEKAIDFVEQYSLKESECVRFGQLQGFSDQITMGLADDKYKVFKAVPFGPTEQIMPYLVRRGQESR